MTAHRAYTTTGIRMSVSVRAVGQTGVMSNAGPQPGWGSTPQQITDAPRLNPAQQQVLDNLGSTDRPTFRDDLREHLRFELEDALGETISEAFADSDEKLFISKHKLSMLHGCETRFIAEEQAEFSWTVPSARGTVAHKAIELLITRRGNPTPIELTEDAMDRLEADNRSISEFIQTMAESERADLVGKVNSFVSTFVETFPPLSHKWVPVAESRVRADLCADKLALQGVIDLSLGRARGNEAGKVLIDLKTGAPHVSHIEDLRFYSLLETMKVGVPPRLLVNYYLEAGEPRTEVVTEDLLWSTAMRVADAVHKLIELTVGSREPTVAASGICRFCPALNQCDTGEAYLKARDDD